MTESEAAAQRVFEARGYLVISALDPLPIGEVIDDEINWSPDHDGTEMKSCKLVVIAETDEQDHAEQARMAGFTRWKNTRERCLYYRVVAE